MATLISVTALVQLIGATSAKVCSPANTRETVADIPTRPAAQALRTGGGFAALTSGLVGFHVKSSDAQQRTLVRLRGAAQQIAEDLVAFYRFAAFDIAQHRGLQRRTHGGQRRPPSLERRLAERKTLRGRDRGALVEKPKREICGASRYVIAHRGPHEACYACGRGDEHPLFPHFLPDLVAEPSVKAGVEQRCGDGLDPWRPRAVQFAEAQRVPIIEMDDHAVGAEGCGDGALPAEHAFGAKAFDEPVDVAHAV